MDFGREKGVFPLVLIQVKSATKRTVFGLKNKREKAFLPFKTQLFHIQVVRYAASKGDAQPLIKFFDGSDKRFIIPLYQRNYDWKEENCEQLFNDLLNLHESNRKSHFFGSIVSSIQPRTEDRYIIDGQQRITTVSLLLIAMVNAKKEGLIEAVDSKLVEKKYSRDTLWMNTKKTNAR